MDFLKKHRRLFITTVSVVCVLLIAVTVTYRTKPTLIENVLSAMTAPVQSALTGAGGWVSQKIDFLTNMSSLYDENQTLKNKISLLTVENNRLKQVDAENESLAALLETKRKYADYPTMAAQTVDVDPGNWYNRFTIDKGSNQGIKKNMAVVADGALIGRVMMVWPNYALINSIIDETSAVSAISAKSARTSDAGVVRGDVELGIDGLCLMEFTNKDVDVMPGDEIVTSQLSSIYPPGITIGHVTEVYTDSKGMKAAVIKPVANFKKVEYVLVITRLYDYVNGDE